MAYRKIGTNKYRISVELGNDILGNRRRKTQVIYDNIFLKEQRLNL